MRITTFMAALALTLMIVPSSANADWFVAPYAGGLFGSNARGGGFLSPAVESERWNIGATAGWTKGWWDAYVEGRPKRAAWSTRAGQGSYTVPLGRGITAAALSVGGRFVAFSTTTELSIGSIADTVLVKRASDGADVFRRTLPAYARSHVAFLGERHFA